METGAKRSLQNRFRWIEAGVVGLMLLMGVVSIVLVTQNTRSMQQILAANQQANDLQQAVSNEMRSFKDYIQSGSEDALVTYEAAAMQTSAALAALPFDYRTIGESRYEITWSIRSSYRIYCQVRNRVLEMEKEDGEYIPSLYKVYSMQEYLAQYCTRLSERVLQEGSAHYRRESAVYLRLPYLLMCIELACLLSLIWLLYTSLGSIFRGLGELAAASRSIEKNIFTQPDVVWNGNDEMGALVRAFNKMKHATRENLFMQQKLHKEELERVELEKRFAAAQFQALKNQLNPHFLFNTLNTIARMAKIEAAPNSERMTLAVSNLLRYNLRTNDPLVPLAQELKVVRDYMYIQEMRFGDRIRCRVDCRVDENEPVPSFLLQPLVENAIQHGLSPKEDGGSICICVRKQDQRLRIAVADTGIGMEPERLEAVRRSMHEGDNAIGIGLCNLERRISGIYTDGTAAVYSCAGHGTAVIMEFGEVKPESKGETTCIIS